MQVFGEKIWRKIILKVSKNQGQNVKTWKMACLLKKVKDRMGHGI